MSSQIHAHARQLHNETLHHLAQLKSMYEKWEGLLGQAESESIAPSEEMELWTSRMKFLGEKVSEIENTLAEVDESIKKFEHGKE